MTDVVVPEGKVIFPAKFSDSVLAVLQEIVPPHTKILDPFAGTGRVHELAQSGRVTYGVEIEPELAALHPRTFEGNSLELEYLLSGKVHEGKLITWAFDAIVTSCTYGNRFADHHNPADNSQRRSYTHDMRTWTGDPKRKLHPDNSGTLHFGPAYINFHRHVWGQCARVLVGEGWMFLNVSDFIRRGKRVPVVSTHRGLLKRAGFVIDEQITVPTPRMRYGENHEARVDGEVVIVAHKET